MSTVEPSLDIERMRTLHKECVKCKGEFQYNEQVYLDIYNQPHCEVCYKETHEV